MVVYHGTTMRRARRICEIGFLPKRPSKRVWFAKERGYADGRARTQARRSHDRPVILTCDIDLERLRNRLGRRRVFHSHGVIAIDGTVPVSALRSAPLAPGLPSSPEELATWLNNVLQVKPWKGVSPRSDGVLRLSRWVANCVLSRPNSKIPGTELLAMARHGGVAAPMWAEYGLKDPSPCVRAETATYLKRFDPVRHRRLFEIAVFDPNPEISRRARRLSLGHPWVKSTYRPGRIRQRLAKPGPREKNRRVAAGRRC